MAKIIKRLITTKNYESVEEMKANLIAFRSFGDITLDEYVELRNLLEPPAPVVVTPTETTVIEPQS